ncbi:MAG: DUF6519 domain-containing protein [Chloroflexia bacterium]
MEGDFTRDTFDPTKHFSRVLIQQGRVPLDADANEQTAILLHYLQTLAADLIGPYAGPVDNCGFEIVADPTTISARLKPPQAKSGPTVAAGDLLIGKGNYYVDGILCENEADLLYSAQTDLVSADMSKANKPPYLVYLDVWERLVTSVEDPGIREIALGGADTAARARVMQQVRITAPDRAETREAVYKGWAQRVQDWQPDNRGLLSAQAKEVFDSALEDPCVISPTAQYRGAENQLYRVEIHNEGEAGVSANSATFKWSRDNASVVAPILSLTGAEVTLDSWPQDVRLGVEIGDWVEVVDDDLLRGNPNTGGSKLFLVQDIDPVNRLVTLIGTPDAGKDQAKHPMLRRWDQKGDLAKGNDPTRRGAVALEEDKWLDLEDGVQIHFTSTTSDTAKQPKHQYRAGDYWMIPARTATGDVDWPGAPDKPMPPHGVTHHYAPLALVLADNADNKVIELRWSWAITLSPPPEKQSQSAGHP